MTDALVQEAVVGTSEMLDVGGGQIHLQRGGHGAPLVHLHAAGGAGVWFPYHGTLARHFEVFAPDHPGFGRSDLLDNVNDVDDLVYHYLDLFDRLELDRVVLVGESFGGWLAAEIATHSPQRVAKLVLMGAPGLRIPGHMPLDIFLATPEQLAKALFHNPAVAAAMFPTEPTIENIVRAYTEASTFAHYAFAPFLNNKKLERRLARITAPTLVLWAENDELIQRIHGERYVERIPDARLQLIEQSGHAMSAEQTEAVTNAIVAFAAS